MLLPCQVARGDEDVAHLRRYTLHVLATPLSQDLLVGRVVFSDAENRACPGKKRRCILEHDGLPVGLRYPARVAQSECRLYTVALDPGHGTYRPSRCQRRQGGITDPVFHDALLDFERYAVAHENVRRRCPLEVLRVEDAAFDSGKRSTLLCQFYGGQHRMRVDEGCDALCHLGPFGRPVSRADRHESVRETHVAQTDAATLPGGLAQLRDHRDVTVRRDHVIEETNGLARCGCQLVPVDRGPQDSLCPDKMLG